MYELNKHYKIIVFMVVSVIALYTSFSRVIEYRFAEIEYSLSEQNNRIKELEQAQKLGNQDASVGTDSGESVDVEDSKL